MSSCTKLAHVRNSNGEVVESNLFGDLLHYLPTRGLAKEYYAVGTNQDWLDNVRDKAKFDENGEITFESLRHLAGINVDEEMILNSLNKQIGAGTYEFNEAIGRLQSFNRNSQFKDRYMATVKFNEGKFELSVVPRNKANEVELEEQISNRTLQERILYHLNKAGVSVEFIKEDDKVGGRYSTINAKRTAEGFYQLIRVAQGEKLTDVLAEEAGHFAIGALGNSPLVERLMQLLTPEVQREILGEEYNTKALGSNSRREVAGMLVGQAITNGSLNEKPWQRLAHRIVDLAKRVFSVFKNDNGAYKARLEAKELAEKIAGDFMSSNFSGSVDEALKTRETLYSAASSYNVRTYREVVNRLNKTVAELGSISNNILTQKMKGILGITESGRSASINSGTVFADSMALDGIAEALNEIADMLGPGKDIDNILKSVDFNNNADFLQNMPENGRKLRQVHTFVYNSIALESLIRSAVTQVTGKESLTGDVSNVNIVDSLGNVVSINLNQVLNSLNQANQMLLAELTVKEKQFFCRFCEDTLGSKSVTMAAKVLWNKKNRWNLEFSGEQEIKVEDALTFLEKDIDLFERFIGSMSNNNDIIGQIVDRATKMANKQADDLTNQCWDQLKVLQSRLHKLGYKDTAFLFERSSRTGELTGNIISQHNWGDYEADYQEFKDEEFENFKQNTPNLDQLTEFEKGVLWDQYFRPLSKAWHQTHSIYDQNLQRYVPNDMYYNDEYDRIVASDSRLEQWYWDFRQLKDSLDERIPEGSTLSVRMPQFKGKFLNRVRNQSSGWIKATGHAIRGTLADTFCESSEDTDYGSNNTYNSEEEERFANALQFEKDKINRIPLYGINKLKDMTELSTDLFHSTLAYAGMANSYLAMSTIVDTLEVGKDVIAKRKVAGMETEEERKTNKSRAYNRYVKFLDKQVYGISSTKHKIGKVVFEKIVAALSGFASKYFLGGNVAGGMVNTMTGFNEIFKEACAGEYFTVKDFARANKLYFGNFVQNWMDYGNDSKDNKTALFVRHFNILGDNRQDQRDWKTGAWNRIYNMFSQSLYLPYKSGDHWMQCMSYLAVASKTMLYDSYGNKISLWNAYKVVDNEDEYGRKSGKTLELDGTFFKDEHGQEEYEMIQDILSQMRNATSGPFGGVINLTQEEQDYLNNKGYSLADTENTIKALEEDAYKLTWNIDDESAYMDKCREVNNRMHGIYNNQDKVAFQQSWYGNAVLAMRGYALGMAERRFGGSKYSVALGHDVEGSLNTMAKLVASTFTDKGGWALTARGLLLPFGKNTANLLQQAGFSANQVMNLKRNWGDFVLMGLLALLRGLTAGGNDDDDREAGLVYYFTNRLYREQSTFNNPAGFYYEANTLLDICPVGLGAVMDLGNMAYQLGGAPFAEEEDSEFYYQSMKEGRYDKYDSKGIVHMKRMTPYLRSVYTFEHPYSAAESFEYGRNIKHR